MGELSLTCPKCGAMMDIVYKSSKLTCPYCDHIVYSKLIHSLGDESEQEETLVYESEEKESFGDKFELNGSGDEIEDKVLGEILSGKIIEARYILMTKKNMSLKSADAYIERLKQDVDI